MVNKTTPSGDFYQVDYNRQAGDAGQWEKLNFALRRMYEQFSKLQGGINAGTIAGPGTIAGSVNTVPPLVGGGPLPATISIPAASAGSSGYLSGSDWTTFNSKLSPGQTMYIGTTAHAVNRASAPEGLSGITGLTPGTDFVHTHNSVAAMTIVESGALVNTLYLKAGLVGIGTTTTPAKLSFAASTSSTDGLQFGTDATPVNLYRSAISTLMTSSNFVAAGITANADLNVIGGNLMLDNNKFIYQKDTGATPVPILGISVDNNTYILSASGGNIVLKTENVNIGITIKTAGVINFPRCPRQTSSAGLTAGDVWCDTTGGLNILKLV